MVAHYPTSYISGFTFAIDDISDNVSFVCFQKLQVAKKKKLFMQV